ncbi:glycosyl transferase [Polychytrium aggregatum]|uniref:glycosyl transferase n=1 Tax=Polychytrium aggregatum TaxID=110093 RepID=UPI0022FE57AE|nr:glycosyl transferase [Polychytrium aggregatum]KAI9208062.1 glycosyl transferase [Polychytrium aggregatum]
MAKGTTLGSPSKEAAQATAHEPAAVFGSPAAGWLSLLQHTTKSRFCKLALISSILFALLCKWAVGLNGYSGKGIEPMHGDFEAQRHWLEITLHLPTAYWYKYDLQYWGLDYPPLTAYHSWLLGWIAHRIHPEWVALFTSRGYESTALQVFMRATALATECAIYLPAIIVGIKSVWAKGRSGLEQQLLVLAVLLQPALILVDHGHFQYNSAMLGFVAWTAALVGFDQNVLAAITFCCALFFKQMSLYYALPVFFYLLGRCIKGPNGLLTFVSLGATVVCCFGVLLVPFLGSVESLLQVFRRVFPVERGLYEDKVANVWCSLSVLVKLRNLFEVQQLVYLSAALTLLAVLPSGINLLLKPSPKRLLYGLLNGSLGFFLCSFMVHEKSILLPLLPATILLLDEPVVGVWFNNVAMFSMFPLLKKDGLVMPYILAVVLWNWLFSFGWKRASGLVKLAKAISYAVIFGLHAMEAVVPPPPRYPDIYVVLNVLFSTSMFVVFFGYYNYRQILSGALDRDSRKQKAA